MKRIHRTLEVGDTLVINGVPLKIEASRRRNKVTVSVPAHQQAKFADQDGRTVLTYEQAAHELASPSIEKLSPV